jgi:hypothetical protein
MGRAKYLVMLLVVCSSISVAVRDAGSCSVPVFRYALERWKPDPYKGIFIYRGKLSTEDRALLQQLESLTLNTKNPFNLRIRPVEVAAFGEERLLGILKVPIPKKLPVLAIWYPEQMGKAAPFWMREVTSDGSNALFDSPKRRQLTEGLINGQSIVWVFIPSGNSGKDENAQKVLRRELDRAADTLTQSPLFTDTGSKGQKLAYSFPILALSRSDARENFFLEMLTHSVPDSSVYKNEPMVFPVFGRGRMLSSLSGEQINEVNIKKIVYYLANSCSCEIKAQHPGMDLLLSAFWDRVVMGELFVNDNATPELTGVMPGPSRPVSAPQEQSEKPIPHSGIWRMLGITLSSAIVVVIFIGWALSRRRKENR